MYIISHHKNDPSYATTYGTTLELLNDVFYRLLQMDAQKSYIYHLCVQLHDEVKDLSVHMDIRDEWEEVQGSPWYQ